MKIRNAEINDTRAIARVHIDAWRTTYRDMLPEDFLKNLSYEQREQFWYSTLKQPKPNEFVYVAEAPSGQIVGFAIGGMERSNHPIYRGELYAIYVLEAYQRQQIGLQLFEAIKEQLAQAKIHSLLVWVIAENYPARRFYERLGGIFAMEKPIEVAGVSFIEIAYGWDNISTISLR